MTAAPPCLSVQHVSKHFGGVHALTDISIDIPAGAGIHGIIGPNGAGKTTLFNVLTGFVAPTSGRVLVEGSEVTGLRQDRVFQKGVSRTYQGVRLFAHLTVEENVGIAAGSTTGSAERVRGRSRPGWFDRTHRPRTEAALDRVGLSGAVRGRYPSELTLWQSRMVELARAISSEPVVLLLDEPAAGLNTAEKGRLSELLVGLSAELGCRLVVVEHDMGFVMSIVEHVWVLNFGCLMAHGTPAEVQANEEVLEAYLGRPDGVAA